MPQWRTNVAPGRFALRAAKGNRGRTTSQAMRGLVTRAYKSLVCTGCSPSSLHFHFPVRGIHKASQGPHFRDFDRSHPQGLPCPSVARLSLRRCRRGCARCPTRSGEQWFRVNIDDMVLSLRTGTTLPPSRNHPRRQQFPRTTSVFPNSSLPPLAAISTYCTRRTSRVRLLHLSRRNSRSDAVLPPHSSSF